MYVYGRDNMEGGVLIRWLVLTIIVLGGNWVQMRCIHVYARVLYPTPTHTFTYLMCVRIYGMCTISMTLYSNTTHTLNGSYWIQLGTSKFPHHRQVGCIQLHMYALGSVSSVGLRMCTYICVYVSYMHIHTYICIIIIRMYTFTYMYKCLCITYVRMYVRTLVQYACDMLMYVRIYVCMLCTR